MMKKPSIWELIKYIFSWFSQRKKANEASDREHLKEVVEDLDEEYQKIDEKKKKQRDKDLDDRLDNMFK